MYCNRGDLSGTMAAHTKILEKQIVEDKLPTVLLHIHRGKLFMDGDKSAEARLFY